MALVKRNTMAESSGAELGMSTETGFWIRTAN